MDREELIGIIEKTIITKWEDLDLSFENISEFPSEIGNLYNLKELIAIDSRLISLPVEIGNLKNLIKLDLCDNYLISLPSEIGNLKFLTKLNLRNNKLTSLPPEIGKLMNLSELRLYGNMLTSLPSEIENLTNLKVLNLKNNQLTSLPYEINNLEQLEVLDVRGNNLDIPPEILGNYNNPRKILDYYFAVLETEKAPLNEAKIVLVGQGDVGKTCVLKRLLNRGFNEKEAQTEGLNIERWNLEVNDKNISVNIWDFGGQEIYHSTHQCFLTKRTLYLLVLDSRQDPKSNRVDYWLKVIEGFADDSPVIIIGNQCDVHEFDINIDKYKEKYPNIKAYIEKVSCKDGTGIEELIDKIKETINYLDHVHDPVPLSWKRIKEELEKMDSQKIDFITREKFKEMCSKEDITDKVEQNLLAGFMNDLGVAINYLDSSRPELKDLNILNPEWVTNGIYKIVTSNWKNKEKAVLCLNDISEILGSNRYPPEKNYFLINLMENFELCFRFKEKGETKFLIPSQLRRKEPLLEGWEDSLAFQIHYEVLPESIMSRFIVRNHLDIPNEMYWREGCLIKKDKNMALVKSDTDENIMFIKVKGDKKTRKDLLQYIRDDLKRIHNTFSNLKPKEKVPVPSHPEAKPIDYQVLLDSYNYGNRFYVGETENGSIPVDVEELLFGVITKKEVQEYQKSEVPMDNRKYYFGDIKDSNLQIGGIKNQATITKTIQPVEVINNNEDLKQALLYLIQLVNQNNELTKELKTQIVDELNSFRNEALSPGEFDKRKSKKVKNRAFELLETLKDAATEFALTNEIGNQLIQPARYLGSKSVEMQQYMSEFVQGIKGFFGG